jgi:CRP/FNR family transcriptional regulator, cyclic AMP receptor protein
MADPALIDELIPLLRTVGVFSRCSDYDLTVVARKATIREVPAGVKVITQGEDSSEMFLVLRGGAVAVMGEQVVNTFGPGGLFGELAALVPAPRTSDVVTTEPSQLAVLSRSQVYLLIDAIPGVAQKMIEGLAINLRDRIQAP